MYEDILPFVLENKTLFSAEETLLIVQTANQSQVKKNVIKRMLFELSFDKVTQVLQTGDYKQIPQLKQTIYQLIKELKGVMTKEAQKE